MLCSSLIIEMMELVGQNFFWKLRITKRSAEQKKIGKSGEKKVWNPHKNFEIVNIDKFLIEYLYKSYIFL